MFLACLNFFHKLFIVLWFHSSVLAQVMQRSAISLWTWRGYDRRLLILLEQRHHPNGSVTSLSHYWNPYLPLSSKYNNNKKNSPSRKDGVALLELDMYWISVPHVKAAKIIWECLIQCHTHWKSSDLGPFNLLFKRSLKSIALFTSYKIATCSILTLKLKLADALKHECDTILSMSGYISLIPVRKCKSIDLPKVHF